MPLIRTSILSIGQNKGMPRIWLEGKHLQLAGFTAGRKVRTSYGSNEIVVTLASTGDHTEIRRATRKSDGTVGSVFSGGGLLDEAARQAGYRSRFALEIIHAHGRVLILLKDGTEKVLRPASRSDPASV